MIGFAAHFAGAAVFIGSLGGLWRAGEFVVHELRALNIPEALMGVCVLLLVLLLAGCSFAFAVAGLGAL